MKVVDEYVLVMEVPEPAEIATLSLDHATVGSARVEATQENVTAAPKTAACAAGEVVIPERVRYDGW